jgi:hypothetical protein
MALCRMLHRWVMRRREGTAQCAAGAERAAPAHVHVGTGLRDPIGGEFRRGRPGRVVGYGEVALSGRWVDLRVEVSSAASAERVFEVLTDWPRHREWMPFTRAEGG